ncbi:hypothetical protein BDU57DRAFT_461805 [Ampelomyces quisqualis]|uniref:Rhodopsin domain-containing protein n=1 Tax=Ampelomyces quisqualis TaxID=50730 RepID=A0A6A5Q7Q1_AMPQU|nr:hypothetical protein BDU57DRAFT_461805 [Ampelomyces quisqualis]
MATTTLQVFAYIVTWICFPIGIASSLVRIYSCSHVSRTWNPDDYISVAMGLALIGVLAFWQVGLSLGCGGPEPNKCNYFDLGGALVRYLYILPIYYTFMHFIIKNAFLAYYLRLSPNRNFRLWVGVGFGLNMCSFLYALLIVVFQCTPVTAALKTLARLTAQCTDRQFVLYTPAVINVILDIYIFILPIPTLARLQMPRRKKWAVLSVFLFGGGAVIMGILRFHPVVKLLAISSTSSGVGEIIIIVALELNLAALAVNLPAIRSIYVKRANDRKNLNSRLTNGGAKYGSGSKPGGESQTVSNVGGRPRDAHEMRQLQENPLRDSPLSDSQEELWRNIENAGENIPTRHKTISSRHEQFSTVDLS